jgi:hypothetical protein
MRAAIVACLLVLALPACSRDEEGPSDVRASGGASPVAGGTSAPGASSPVAGAGGARVPEGQRCDRCGASREACSTSFSACLDDDACRELLDCVYASDGCALDAGGASCVVSCALSACSTPRAVALFLEADRCTYCTAACQAVCSSYCAALDHDAFACPSSGGAGGQGQGGQGAASAGAGS